MPKIRVRCGGVVIGDHIASIYFFVVHKQSPGSLQNSVKIAAVLLKDGWMKYQIALNRIK
jgi:hypothetical protein